LSWLCAAGPDAEAAKAQADADADAAVDADADAPPPPARPPSPRPAPAPPPPRRAGAPAPRPSAPLPLAPPASRLGRPCRVLSLDRAELRTARPPVRPRLGFGGAERLLRQHPEPPLALRVAEGVLDEPVLERVEGDHR